MKGKGVISLESSSGYAALPNIRFRMLLKLWLIKYRLIILQLTLHANRSMHACRRS
jgi:hypothetical protein